jgi:excisionase family DNA binding protein
MSATVVFERRYATLGNAARYTGLSIKTLRRWLDRGLLTAYRPAGTGRQLVDLRDLDRLILTSPEKKETAAM